MALKDYVKYELIGSQLEVVDSKNKSLIGMKGKIIDETKNILFLDNKKKLIKNQSTFKIKFKNKTIKIKGQLLVCRPEDRLKKKIK